MLEIRELVIKATANTAKQQNALRPTGLPARKRREEIKTLIEQQKER